MFSASSLSGDKSEQYAQLAEQARALLHGERDRVANAANLAALVYHALPRLNWAGFYFHDGGELVVGPFQGLPACVRIPLDRGVCGAAARSRQTQRVDDVHAFPGHIACSSSTQSEVVVPVVTPDGRLLAVLDVDSDFPAAFQEVAQRFLERLCTRLGEQFSESAKDEVRSAK